MKTTPMTPETGVDWGESRTKQSAEPESNINNIMARYKKTGELTHVAESLGEYRDVSGLPDLEQAMNIVADAQSMFMELPPHIRKRVGHDVGNFLPFLDDPANKDECIALGLISGPTARETHPHINPPEDDQPRLVDPPPSPPNGGE